MASKTLLSRNVVLTSITVLFCCVLYPIAFSRKPFDGRPSKFSESVKAGECERPSYIVRMISHDPLMMHLENFITPGERRHLLEVAATMTNRSTVLQRNGTKLVSSQRTSSSAFLPKDDPVARCVSERAAEFQGYEALENIEGLQITAYTESQEYRDHFDWYGRKMNTSTDRVTTIFGILEADCDNCGTRFPRIPVKWETEDQRWCRIVDCKSSALVVKPLPGSALFWRNLESDGSGDQRMLHAGMPLSRGFKTGLNIWTRQEIESEA